MQCDQLERKSTCAIRNANNATMPGKQQAHPVGTNWDGWAAVRLAAVAAAAAAAAAVLGAFQGW
jgi:hypothetical protein